MVLAGAPRASTTKARRAGPAFEAVAWEWLEDGERKRGLKDSTIKDYRYLPRNHLLPAFGERPVRAIRRQDTERWHSGYERARTHHPIRLSGDELLPARGWRDGQRWRSTAPAVALVALAAVALLVLR
jgi:Phage integrase, N-terminal SAM-like domain